jgi:hypothetical protein
MQRSYGAVLLMNETNHIVDVSILDARLKAGMTYLLREEGILHNGLFYPSFAHTPKQFSNFERKMKIVFNKLSKLDISQFKPMDERPVVVR